MALVERRTDYRGATCARARLTGVGLCTGVAVVTARAVGLRNGGRARPRCRHAAARRVALVPIGTHHRGATRADAALTGVTLRTGIAIVTRRARLRNWRGARPRCGHAVARLVALVPIGTHHRGATRADAALTGIALRTGIAVVTRRALLRNWRGARPSRGVTRA